MDLEGINKKEVVAAPKAKDIDETMVNELLGDEHADLIATANID